jgi:hypothetical protein
MKTPFVPRILILLAMLSPSAGFAQPDYEAAERLVESGFRKELNREPSTQERYQYVFLVTEQQLDPQSFRRELRSDFRSNSSPVRGRDEDYYQHRRWVESAFEDKVGRLPNQQEMDDYCQLGYERRYDRSSMESLIEEDYRDHRSSYSISEDARYDYRRYTSGKEAEIIVREAYRDILHREPDEEGMRNYRSLLIDKGWSERQLRHHLANSPEVLYEQFSVMIIRAYEDLLDREPSKREIDGYVDDMTRHHWDEKKLRDMIRKSDEYQHLRPRKIIQEAYRKVLLREPEEASYEGLRREILKNNWRLPQVEDHLRKSNEYRNTTIPKMIKQAYEEVLKRQPDPEGERFYFSKAHQGWTFEQIKDHMKKSDEYRKRFP